MPNHNTTQLDNEAEAQALADEPSDFDRLDQRRDEIQIQLAELKRSLADLRVEECRVEYQLRELWRRERRLEAAQVAEAETRQ